MTRRKKESWIQRKKGKTGQSGRRIAKEEKNSDTEAAATSRHKNTEKGTEGIKGVLPCFVMLPVF